MQTRAESTHQHILTAALACFSQTGYESTSVAEICAQAGVTKGAFYFHFPSKQALFLELLNRWLDSLDERLTAVREEGKNIAESFLLLAETAGQIFSEAHGQLPLFIEFWDQAMHDPAIWQATIEPYRRYQDFFAGWIQQGVVEGSLRPVDPQVTARIFVSLAVGLVLQGVVDPQGADWAHVLKESMSFMVYGLERKA